MCGDGISVFFFSFSELRLEVFGSICIFLHQITRILGAHKPGSIVLFYAPCLFFFLPFASDMGLHFCSGWVLLKHSTLCLFVCLVFALPLTCLVLFTLDPRGAYWYQCAPQN
jgi:hypothetical protein